MSIISKKEVAKISFLARIELSKQEIKEHKQQLAKILSYMKKLGKINTDKVEPSKGGNVLFNIFREDKVGKRDVETRDKILKNAPKTKGDFIETKRPLNL